MYFYRFDDLSKNEYSFKYKNYIDGVYYLTDKLYKNLTKYNITDIDIIQPNIGIADFFISSHKILSNRLIKSVFTRIYLCNSFVPFSFIIISLLISTTIDFTIVKCTGIAIFILSFIINYIKMRKMIRNKHDGIIYSENELERYIKRHMGLDAIIVYGDKYSTIRFEDTIFRDELSKNIVNLIIYLRVLFIAFKQNYSTDEYINKIKEIENIIINRYDNRIIFYILLYLALSVSDCKKIGEIAQIRKDNHNFTVFELYKRAICFFKLNCFYGDIEKYYKLSKII